MQTDLSNGSVSKVEMIPPITLICKALFPSISTFETPPGRTAFAAQWPAYVSPYRLLVCLLAETSARLGADVVRYTFIVEDFHFLLLASLLANLGVLLQ